jgi:hypothetical protein
MNSRLNRTRPIKVAAFSLPSMASSPTVFLVANRQ